MRRRNGGGVLCFLFLMCFELFSLLLLRMLPLIDVFLVAIVGFLNWGKWGKWGGVGGSGQLSIGEEEVERRARNVGCVGSGVESKFLQTGELGGWGQSYKRVICA